MPNSTAGNTTTSRKNIWSGTKKLPVLQDYNDIQKHLVNFMSFNCRSIRNKVPEIMSQLEDMDIDVALFQETWINKGDNAVIAEIKDHGYDVIHVKRNLRDIGGGVTTIFKHGLQMKKAQQKTNFRSFEVNITIFKGKQKDIKIANIYRPTYSKKHRVTAKTFIKEFNTLLGTVQWSNFNCRGSKCPCGKAR